MISRKMQEMVSKSSAIRAMFEEGQKMASVYGKENVYDFSLGNPSLHPPTSVAKAMKELLVSEEPTRLHGYTSSNAGFEEVREAVAQSLNWRYQAGLDAKQIVMTVGAAGGLNVILKTLLNPQDEVIVFAPYFGEYRSYVQNYDGILVEVAPDTQTFLPQIEEFAKKITSQTKAVIINTPNNPTGVVYPADCLRQIAAVLEKKQQEFGTSIYLISDEPYRELVYDGVVAEYVPQFYANTISVYSYSKSLSLPGERIGYLVIPKEATDASMIWEAACVATRILGFVNAPTLQQKMLLTCVDEVCEVECYNRNREALYTGLVNLGFVCHKPEGAFYLFVKSPIADEVAFCEEAKSYRILMVPGSSFGCSGYVRLAYCVPYETIQRAMPQFEALSRHYRG
jgi:aspartate aminotransferase